MNHKVISVIGILLFPGSVMFVHSTAADPPFARDDASTEETYIGSGQTFDYENELTPGNYYFICFDDDGTDTGVSEWVAVTIEPKGSHWLSGTSLLLDLLVIYLPPGNAEGRCGPVA